MKLKFNLANGLQGQIVGPVDARTFLELEEASKMAYGVAISQSIETLGPDSPVWPHIESLVRDFGRMPEQAPEAFEILLKAYLAAALKGEKEAAKLLWVELDRRFTDHTADKAFNRLVENCIADLAGIPVIQLGQENIDVFCAAVKGAQEIDWI